MEWILGGGVEPLMSMAGGGVEKWNVGCDRDVPIKLEVEKAVDMCASRRAVCVLVLSNCVAITSTENVGGMESSMSGILWHRNNNPEGKKWRCSKISIGS